MSDCTPLEVPPDPPSPNAIAPSIAYLATPVTKLVLLEGNPRRGDVKAIAQSLATFGQRKPIVARRNGTVIAGNHTLMAALSLGWGEVAVVWVDDDDTTASAFALADNRTAELGTYDEAALIALLAQVDDPGLLAATGWSSDDAIELAEHLSRSTPEPVPPAGFAMLDEDDITTTHTCPVCRFRWSGNGG